MPRSFRPILWLLALAVFVGGCGGEGAASGERSSRLVDFTKKPPYVNAFDVLADGHYLLSTNRGLFRIDPRDDRVERVRARADSDQGSSPVGTFLAFRAMDEDELVGSGHPDDEDALPPYLGFMRSQDGGRTWEVVNRLGEADLHQIRLAHGRLYAFDAVLGAILVSEDGGRTWNDRRTPRQLVVDFVVDPDDPERLVIATEDQLYRSTDGGASWRPLAEARSPRLAWPAAGTLLRADADGALVVSADGGGSWRPVGRVEGEPYEIHAFDARRALVVLSDGTVLETADGGRSFEEDFRP